MRLLLLATLVLTLAACDSSYDPQHITGLYSGPATFPGSMGTAALSAMLTEGPASDITGTGTIAFSNGQVFAVDVDGSRTKYRFKIGLTSQEGSAFDYRFEGDIEDDGQTLDGLLGYTNTPVADRRPLTLRLEGTE